VDKQIRILIDELKKRGGSANYGELFAATDGVMPALSATLQVFYFFLAFIYINNSLN